MLEAALAAHDAGLSVVRVAVDGTKQPVGRWKEYQSARADRDTVEGWFAGGHAGLGVICGQVSGGLEMFEFEGRALEDGTADAFREAMKAAGLDALLRRIMLGYREVTPSGGRHLLYRCAEISGNTKLARRIDPETGEVEVLIETRGEGGFVVVAPSNGSTHPSGRPWELRSGGFDTIATITPDERNAMFDVARTFDQPAPPSSATDVHSVAWNDAEVTPWEDFDRTHSCGQVLEAAGFVMQSTSSDGVNYTRPGKDPRLGSSATVWNDDATCTLFSTSINAPGEFVTGHRKLRPSQLHAALNHGGDFARAASEWRRTMSSSRRTVGQNPVTAGAARTAPAEDLNLPESFWSARPWLGTVRAVARRRLVPPDHLLGCVLARMAALTPHTVALPALVGSYSNLSLLAVLMGMSNAGKSISNRVATELVPAPVGFPDNMPLGSGEGMVEILFDYVEEDVDGKKVKVKRQVRHGAIVFIDEGAVLADLAGRSGSTVLPTIRSIFSGSAIGQTNASKERHRVVPAGQAVFGIVMALQPAVAADLLAGEGAGTPQRFLFMNPLDLDHPGDLEPWDAAPLEPLDWSPPTTLDMRSIEHRPRGYVRHVLEVDDEVATEVRAHRLATLRGHPVDDGWAHRDLVRLKVAAILTIADDRIDITTDDWHLAGVVTDTTHRVRLQVEAEVRAKAEEQHEARIRLQVRATDATTASAESKALASGSRSAGRAVWNATNDSSESVPQRDLTLAVASKHRELVGMEEIIDRAVADGFIVRDVKRFQRGRSDPR